MLHNTHHNIGYKKNRMGNNPYLIRTPLDVNSLTILIGQYSGSTS